MNTRLAKNRVSGIRAYSHVAISLALLSTFSFASLCLAQTAPPPSFGEETKGEPAIIEQATESSPKENKDQLVAQEKKNNQTESGPLGSATIKESRRENGQVYRIEMKHSAGAKQTIEENDSDGSIENTNKGIDDTPNLPKWKLISW